MPSLAAIVPATDDPPTLTQCLAAISRAAEPPDEVLAITEPAGVSPAAARNVGAERTSSEVIVFVDSDVLVHPDAFARIRAAFDGDAGLDAIFGSYDLASGGPGGVTAFRNLLHREVHHESAGPATTFWSGLGAVRREAFDEAGGFDPERFPRPSIEDIELGGRLVECGSRIELDPGIEGTHLKRWSAAAMVRTDLLDRGIPWMRLALESGRLPAAMNLSWRHRLSAVASVAVAAGVIARRPRLLAAAGGALVALNRRFYSVLARRHGRPTAALGVALHLVHHLTSVAAVGAAAVLHLRSRRRSGSRPSPGAGGPRRIR